jgi:hypothetical protein
MWPSGADDPDLVLLDDGRLRHVAIAKKRSIAAQSAG